MSGRVKMIKPKNMSIGVDRTHDLTKFRTKFNYDGNEALNEWIKTLPDNEKDGKIVPTKISFFKNPKKESEKPLPSQLKSFVDFMALEKRIPDDEIRGWTFHVLKPPKVKSDNETSFEQCMAYVSDRFIYIHGSNEKIVYHIIDISKAKAISNLAPNQQIIEDIDEQVKSGNVIHLDFLAAISMLIRVNDKAAYKRPSRKGFREGEMIRKNPLNRTIVILDIIAVTEKVSKVLRQKLEMFDQIVEENPDSKQSKIIKTFRDEMEKDCDEKNRSDDEDVEDVPILVPEDQMKLESTSKCETFDVVDEDFKEISDNF